MRATSEAYRDEVVNAVDAHDGLRNRRVAVEERDRTARLATYADVGVIARQHHAITRREDLDARALRQRPALIGAAILRRAPRRDTGAVNETRRDQRPQTHGDQGARGGPILP